MKVVISCYSDVFDHAHDVVDTSPAGLRAMKSRESTFEGHKAIFPELYAHEYDFGGLLVFGRADIIDPPDDPQPLGVFLAEQELEAELTLVTNGYIVEHRKHVLRPGKNQARPTGRATA